jgi:ABC-2 type transport system ATP-binding protein
MIELKGIRKSFGKKLILDGLDLSVKRGQCIGLVGVNGSGKSTLLAIMAGALKADGGTIGYNGHEMTGREDLSRWAAFVPQDNPLIDELSVRDNLKLWYAGTEIRLKDALDEGLPKELGLQDVLDQRVRNLSGGMKKRVSIACALANDAPILLMDEPAASLDLVMKQDIRRHLDRYLERGGTVVISSHEEDELKMCDELYHLTEHHLQRLPKGIAGEALMDFLTKEKERI